MARAAICSPQRAPSSPRPVRRIVLRVQTGAATSAPANSLTVPAGPPPVRPSRIPVAVAARRRCSRDPLRAGRLPRIRPNPLCARRTRPGGGVLLVTVDGRKSPALFKTRSSGWSLRPGTVCRCGLPVIRSVLLPRRVLNLVSGFDAGEIYPSEIVAHRLAAGSSPSPGMGIRTRSTFGTSNTVDSSPSLNDGYSFPRRSGFLFNRRPRRGCPHATCVPRQAVTPARRLRVLAALMSRSCRVPQAGHVQHGLPKRGWRAGTAR